VVLLADHRDLPDGRAQVGDRHLNFYEPRDNLAGPSWGRETAVTNGQSRCLAATKPAACRL
jgi:hypothetical protein